MSIWTHVNGSIRIDGFDYGCLPKIEKCDLPVGRNGRLEYCYQLVDVGAPLAVFTIYGDLSDFDDIDQIINWIKETFKNNIIRSGLIEINCETNDFLTILHYHEGS